MHLLNGQLFAAQSLKVNFVKSVVVPINLSDERATHFTKTMNCKQGSFPFTYLGFPLGTTKPSLEHFLPMVQRVERRLCGISNFLTAGGKLQMVKSVLSSMSIFFMGTLDVPVTIK